MLIESISEFVEKFRIDKAQNSKATKNLESWDLLVNKIPDAFQDRCKLDEVYVADGSIGKGLITETPWLAVFDSDITLSATVGYYIVYLFRSDLKGFYISLNQGFTQYRIRFGDGVAKEAIFKTAQKIQNRLGDVSPFSFEKIDLKASKILGKGYELGNICSKYYDMNSLPNESIFISDLNNLLGMYKQLKRTVGTNIIDINDQITEEQFQTTIQEGKKKDLPVGPIMRKEKNQTTSISSPWGRDIDISFTALESADFKCEHNNSHETFISSKHKHNFTEAHHLIPLEFQCDFEMSIDVPENIISLCPTCHRGFHHAEEKFKTAIVSKFYKSRVEGLAQRGIIISLDKLLSYYRTPVISISPSLITNSALILNI